MHIITQKRIWTAKFVFPQAASALEGWYRLVRRNNFDNFAELKQVFASVDKVDEVYVFNIGGNKLRLIANIHFNRQKVYIREIVSHSVYDKNGWKKREN